MKILRAILSVAAMILISCGLLVAVPTTTHASAMSKPLITVTATHEIPEQYAYAMLGNRYHQQVTASTVKTIKPAIRYAEVKKGDSLTGIASSAKVAWQSLYCENKQKIGTNPDFITPGERLVIPTVRVRCKIEDGTTRVVTTTDVSSGSHTTSVPPPVTQPVPQGSLQEYALSLLHDNETEFGCLNNVIMRESSWNVYAQNPGSGAYGIPQALPGSKMSVAGSDWATNGYTQLRWMIEFYIPPTYGDACNAWQNELRYGYY